MFEVTLMVQGQELGSYISNHDDSFMAVDEARNKLNAILPAMRKSGMTITETEIILEPYDLQLFLLPGWSVEHDRLVNKTQPTIYDDPNALTLRTLNTQSGPPKRNQEAIS